MVGFELLREGPVPGIGLTDLKGSGWLGYRLGYAGALMLVIAQSYLFRPGLLSKLTWLEIHCYLTTAAGVLLLLHAGFPYSFEYWNPFERVYPRLGLYGLVGLQGLAAWLVVALIASGIFGRYVYGRHRWARTFKRWHTVHAILSGMLYVSGVVHLLLSVSLKYVAAD